MKWTLIYFDDQIQNIECFKELLAADFNVIGCLDATQFNSVMLENHPHAFLLDVHMPVLDGHALYQKINSHPLYNGCPIIFISGDQSDENKLKSFQEGGIDFLPRDLKSEETVARLSNKIRFYLERSTKLELGNLRIDVEAFLVTINLKPIDFTLLEMRILSNLLRSYPKPLTRAQLIFRVWENETVKPGTINTHLTNLRPKIEAWDYIIKVREDNILILKKP
ncbi:MAG TPA: response regulator transcription factor [Bacteriovoracaceae bacterium]|nr:response regulator transcription factor [Bacteriovoracaceae bacterium]